MTSRVAGSFRDPAGFVFERDGVLYRQVNTAFAEQFAQLTGSGLYDALVAAGLLIPHQVVAVAPADPAQAAAVIQPEPVRFVSYPFEWSPGQLQAAALATLRAQQLAMDHGMTLRDASAYNVQFHHGRPVLIDTLSFAPLIDGEPWDAYRQFCQHFLAPLALMANVDVRLGQLLRVHLDGIPLDLAAQLLPARSRLQAGLAMHIRAHAASQRRHAEQQTDSPARPTGRTFSRQAFTGLVESLRKAVEKQAWEPTASAWRDYYAAKESYSEQALAHKEDLVAKVLGDVAPSTVWDFGANTGRFSRLAAAAGAHVLAIEMDPSAVELNWRQVVDNGDTAVLPLWIDLANPTPSQGWAHSERPSLAARGPADLGLALALIHHLAIGGNVPLDDIAAWFASVCHHLVIEWVPKDDPMVRRLLASREDVFTEYTAEHFERAVGRWFTIERRDAVQGSERTLYVLGPRLR